MAKTIKEMADNYVNGFHPSIKKICNESYTDGANAMLDIIEECLEEPSMIQGYSDIMAVVQELKGE